tara:strand:- start:9698 stop:10171 length:474 start_codon:yes stop_codon:yes gene_type:complete
VNFIQICAHIGWDSLSDPRAGEKMNGIMVKPQKPVFEVLVKRFQEFKNIVFQNIAVMPDNSERQLFKVKIAEKDWRTILTLFDKVLLKKRIEQSWFRNKCAAEGFDLPANVDDAITSEMVICKTIQTIMTYHDFSELNLLFTDAEGADFDIIYNIDF